MLDLEKVAVIHIVEQNTILHEYNLHLLSLNFNTKDDLLTTDRSSKQLSTMYTIR